jgi:hypothetical protein
MFGDLDNDNKREVIYQSNANGIYIFEWDGVVGSDNYGNQPSQLINPPFITNTTGNAEYMEVGDPDNDAQQEPLVAYNASTNADDKYYILRAVGDWSRRNGNYPIRLPSCDGRISIGGWFDNSAQERGENCFATTKRIGVADVILGQEGTVTCLER